jgi:TetR/AcrR family transcriptional repressor of nem operon
MARPREFDTESAVAEAMNVFWQHGYDAASLPELLKGMGITRGSLYKAFVDKKSLFLTVLSQYELEVVDPAVQLLTDEAFDGGERINKLFTSVLEAVQNGDQRGCLLCSAAAGPSAVDADIAERVQLQLSKMSNAFYQALTQSLRHEAAAEQEQRDMAGLLVSQYVGLRVMVKSKAPIESIQHSINAVKNLMRQAQ